MSYNKTYKITGEISINTALSPQSDVISDIRSIEGITIVSFSPKSEGSSSTNNRNHAGFLNIKFDTFPFTEFDKETQIQNLVNQIRKIPAVNFFKPNQVNLLENTRLTSLIKEVLQEKKNKRDRCLRIADRKFDKPSAYKSGAVVRCRQGKIWKDLKEDESLYKWFKRQGTPGKEGGWVDCNAPIRKDGKITGYKPCGRQKGEERAKYPSCRPTPAGCRDKGKGKTWGKTK
jgi:hypothetical protein